MCPTGLRPSPSWSLSTVAALATWRHAAAPGDRRGPAPAAGTAARTRARPNGWAPGVVGPRVNRVGARPDRQLDRVGEHLRIRHRPHPQAGGPVDDQPHRGVRARRHTLDRPLHEPGEQSDTDRPATQVHLAPGVEVGDHQQHTRLGRQRLQHIAPDLRLPKARRRTSGSSCPGSPAPTTHTPAGMALTAVSIAASSASDHAQPDARTPAPPGPATPSTSPARLRPNATWVAAERHDRSTPAGSYVRFAHSQPRASPATHNVPSPTRNRYAVPAGRLSWTSRSCAPTLCSGRVRSTRTYSPGATVIRRCHPAIPAPTPGTHRYARSMGSRFSLIIASRSAGRTIANGRPSG